MANKSDVEKRDLSYCLRAVLWYLRRPGLYPDLVRTACSKPFVRRPSAEVKAEAVRWCEDRAVDVSEGIARITGSSTFEPIREKFKDVFFKAEQAAKGCPVKMGGAGSLDLLYWVAESLHAKRVIETGVAYGWSSLAILLSLKNRDSTKLVSTDRPYINLDNDEYVGCVVPHELKAPWTVIAQADREALPKALRVLPTIDMCHYDSDKTHSGRIWAYARLWKALRPGGCLLSDDISDNLGFRDFCSESHGDPIVVRMADPTSKTKYVGALIKPQ